MQKSLNLLLKEEKYSLMVSYLNSHPINNLEYNPKLGYILMDYKRKKDNNSTSIEYSLPEFFNVKFMDNLLDNKEEAIEIMEHFKKTNKGALKEFLLSHLSKKDISMSLLAKQTGYTKQTISKIINGQLFPKKKTLFAIVLAFGLNLDEAKEVLSYAGYTFNPTDPMDVVIEGAITYGYNIMDTNYILYSLDLDTFYIEE